MLSCAKCPPSAHFHRSGNEPSPEKRLHGHVFYMDSRHLRFVVVRFSQAIKKVTISSLDKVRLSSKETLPADTSGITSEV